MSKFQGGTHESLVSKNCIQYIIEKLIFSLWLEFMSVLVHFHDQLDTAWKKELQLKNWVNEIGLWGIVLIDDQGGQLPWAAPFLDW